MDKEKLHDNITLIKGMVHMMLRLYHYMIMSKEETQKQT